MARYRNALSLWVQTNACLLFAWLTARLPLAWARALGRWAGRLGYAVVPRIRRVGMANLDLAYGDKLTRAEKRRILKESSQNLGIVAAEFSRVPKIRGAFLEKHVRFKGLEHVDRTRGWLLIGAHLGNWEWMGPALAAHGFPFAAVVRSVNDPRLTEAIDRTRRAGGTTTVPKAGAGAQVLRLLREGTVVAVLIDQSPRENGVPVRFFGQPCWATVAPVMAAVRARAPVHVAAMVRGPEGRYTFELSRDIGLTRSGALGKDLVENSQRCQDAIEELVRRTPGQWLWFHRRWKPRPRLEKEWQARRKRDNRS